MGSYFNLTGDFHGKEERPGKRPGEDIARVLWERGLTRNQAH
jgi:hypothetical protein